MDADIALHAAVVAAARNPVLTDLFGEFVPALRQGLVDLVDLLGLRSHDPNTGDASHAGLVGAIEKGDGEAAGRILQEELTATLRALKEMSAPPSRLSSHG
ncbi:FCD domain-containing protein [Nonomuraea sp. NPDC049152]|uniref:FCD domain-containing protein n=1 Tax=Nonomuraea sp. NPDC049152 TaxID=3154350 RepID=UPI0033E0820F